ncbi:hypothetical protein K0B04_02350 [Patescibacteria group bacterium]|nr:hypothetical protein [Patescibacteria group bacterium]
MDDNLQPMTDDQTFDDQNDTSMTPADNQTDQPVVPAEESMPEEMPATEEVIEMPEATPEAVASEEVLETSTEEIGDDSDHTESYMEDTAV